MNVKSKPFPKQSGSMRVIDFLSSLFLMCVFMCITQKRTFISDSGAEYIRKEVPLHVLPTSSLLNLESPLTSFTNLQSVLFEEERTAYHQAILQNMRYIRYFITSYMIRVANFNHLLMNGSILVIFLYLTGENT